MIRIMKQNNEIQQYVIEFVVDTVADLELLPTDPKDVYPGSAAIVCETSDVYMLNNNYEWVLL